jgi:hypothetical protein
MDLIQDPGTAEAPQRQAFEEFCELRRGLIINLLKRWVSQMQHDVRIEEAPEVRTEPVPQLFNESLQDRIRGLEYPNMVEDQLLRLIGMSGKIRFRQSNTAADGGLSSLAVLMDNKTVFRIDFRQEVMRLSPSDNKVAKHFHEWLLSTSSRVETELAGQDDRTLLLDCSVANAERTAHLLEIAVNELKRRSAG